MANPEEINLDAEEEDEGLAPLFAAPILSKAPDPRGDSAVAVEGADGGPAGVDGAVGEATDKGEGSVGEAAGKGEGAVGEAAGKEEEGCIGGSGGDAEGGDDFIDDDDEDPTGLFKPL